MASRSAAFAHSAKCRLAQARAQGLVKSRRCEMAFDAITRMRGKRRRVGEGGGRWGGVTTRCHVYVVDAAIACLCLGCLDACVLASLSFTNRHQRLPYMLVVVCEGRVGLRARNKHALRAMNSQSACLLRTQTTPRGTENQSFNATSDTTFSTHTPHSPKALVARRGRDTSPSRAPSRVHRRVRKSQVARSKDSEAVGGGLRFRSSRQDS